MAGPALRAAVSVHSVACSAPSLGPAPAGRVGRAGQVQIPPLTCASATSHLSAATTRAHHQRQHVHAAAPAPRAQCGCQLRAQAGHLKHQTLLRGAAQHCRSTVKRDGTPAQAGQGSRQAGSNCRHCSVSQCCPAAASCTGAPPPANTADTFSSSAASRSCAAPASAASSAASALSARSFRLA